MKPSIIHLILLLSGTVADAYIDKRLIKKKKDVHNFWQYFWRIFGFLALSATFAYWYDNEYAGYSFVLSFIVYWWPFDTVLNIFRFRSFAFKDLIYLSDRGIDRIQRPMEIAFFIKLLACVCASLYFFNRGLMEWWK